MRFEANTDITDRLSEDVKAAQPGDVIKIPEGEYFISAPIRLRSGVAIVGAGMDKTILTVNKNGLQALFKAEEKEGIALRNFSVNGMGLTTKHVLIAEDCTKLTVDSLNIYDMDGNIPTIAVQFEKTTHSIIQNCTFTNISVSTEWGCAVRLSHGSSYNVVDNNRISNTGRGGILCDNNSEYLTITNNTITGSGKTSEGLSIELWGNCGYSVVEDNRVDHWLSLDNAPFTAVRRNIIGDKTGEVKFLGLETVGSSNIVLTDNVIDQGQYIGISASNIEPKEYAYWANTEVYGCQQWGAQFQGEEGGVRYQYFYNLQIADTFTGKEAIYPGDAGHGFRFNDSCEYFIFEGGRICNNEGSAIQKLGNVEEIYFIGTQIYGNGDDEIADVEKMRLTIEALPKASFACVPEAKVGQSVAFTNRSDGNAGEIRHVLWDFGEGIPSIETNPSHAYEKAGEYTVTLIVWNEEGLAGRAEQKLVVTE